MQQNNLRQRIEKLSSEQRAKLAHMLADRSQSSYNQQLVAYIVGKQDVPVDESQVRARLADGLPHYMVPQHIVVLDALPRTPNGKIDRAALSEIKPVKPVTPMPYVQAHNEFEAILVDIWQNVLGVDHVGVDDDFFALGGDSLRVLRVLQQFEKTTGHKLAPTAFLRHPTIAQLVRTITDTADDTTALDKQDILTLQRGAGTSHPFFLIHTAGGGVLDYMELIRQLPDDQTIYGLQATSVERIKKHTSLEDLASDYSAMIAQICPAGVVRIGGHSLGAILAYEVGYQLALGGQHQVQLFLFDSGPDPYREMSQWDRFMIRFNRERLRIRQHMQTIREQGVLSSVQHYYERVRVKLRKRSDKRQLQAIPVYNLDNWHARIAQENLDTEYHEWIVAALRPLIEAYYPYKASIPTVIFLTDSDPQIEEIKQYWERWFDGNVVFEKVTGDHLTILQRPHVAVLADRLTAHLT